MMWLGVIAKNFYRQQLGSLMTSQIQWPAAIIFYLLFIAGLVVFVISPAFQKHSWIQALCLGAFFGLVSYATYDLTNLATLKNWPLLVSLVDLVWGAVLGGLVSVITYSLATKLL